MKLTYRTRRILQRVFIIALTVLILGITVWVCGMIWVERFLVYSEDGAVIDFDAPKNEGPGQLATPPEFLKNPPKIFFNEGANSIETSNELKQLTGYHIDSEMLTSDFATVQETVSKLKRGTAVMIDMKGINGTFYYNSHLEDALISTAVDVEAVQSLVKEMNRKGLYTIARIPAYRDRNFGLNHVSSGLPVKGGYLWMDSAGCYWLKPNDAGTQNFLYGIIDELRSMGFDEVMLTDFRFPESEKIIYNDDRAAVLQKAATDIAAACGKYNFVISFQVADVAFGLPGERCRLYVENVPAKDAETVAARSGFENPAVNLVFLANSNDTRYSQYSVIRPLYMAQDIENQD